MSRHAKVTLAMLLMFCCGALFQFVANLFSRYIGVEWFFDLPVAVMAVLGAIVICSIFALVLFQEWRAESNQAKS